MQQTPINVKLSMCSCYLCIDSNGHTRVSYCDWSAFIALKTSLKLPGTFHWTFSGSLLVQPSTKYNQAPQLTYNMADAK